MVSAAELQVNPKILLQNVVDNPLGKFRSVKIHVFYADIVIGGILSHLDGHVGAVIDSGRYYITSPNSHRVPHPPLGTIRHIYLRRDCFYGDDDPVRWPQPYNKEVAHYACIPLPPRNNRDMLWSHVWAGWGTLAPGDVAWQDRGAAELGVVGEQCYRTLHDSQQWLIDWVTKSELREKFRNKPAALQYYNSLLWIMKRMLLRLGTNTSPMHELQRSLAEFQRAWLIMLALHDFTFHYQPILNGQQFRGPGLFNYNSRRMGLFTYDESICDMYMRAKIPVWLIRPVSTFNLQIIYDVQAAYLPSEFGVDLRAHPRYPSILYTGNAGDSGKYMAIHGSARLVGQHPDPFTSIRNQVCVEGTGAAGLYPTTEHLHMARTRDMPRIASLYDRGFSRRGNSSQDRDKFAELSGPFAPPALPAWENVNARIDRNSRRSVQFEKEPGEKPLINSYFFPDPGMVLGVTDRKRQIGYFRMWEHLKEAWKARAMSNQAHPVALTSQQWREVLALAQTTSNKGPRPGTHHARVHEKVSTLVMECLDILGVQHPSLVPANATDQVSEGHAQRVIWELCELGFRMELVWLDATAAPFDPRTHTTDVPTEMALEAGAYREERQNMTMECFPSTNASLLGFTRLAGSEGFADSDQLLRLKTVKALWRLMDGWSGDKPSWWNTDEFRLSADEVMRWEERVVFFYCQTFFDRFGRAPTLPRRLPALSIGSRHRT